MHPGAAIVLVVLATPRSAPELESSPASVPFLLPRATIAVSTKGDATIQVAADLWWNFRESAFSLTPVFEATASSNKAVFSTNETTLASSFPIRFGLEGTFYATPLPNDVSDKEDQIDLDARKSCESACRCGVVKKNDKSTLDCASTSSDCERFNKVANEVDIITNPAILLPTQDLCSAGKKYREKFYGRSPSAFPLWQASIGFTTGVDSFDYLEPQGGGTLVPVDGRKYGSGRIAGYLAAIPFERRTPLQASFELYGSGEWKHRSSSPEARWCTPAGSVPREGGGSDVAEVCETRPLGTPQNVTLVTAYAAAGLADGMDARWRGAIGPSFKSVGGDSWLGVTVPIYVRFAGDESAGQFKGIVAVTLTARWRLNSGPSDPSRPDQEILLSLALLGRRSLFGTALQQ